MFTLDQLVFLRNVAFFIGDAREDMRDLGISDNDIFDITSSEAFRKCDIVAWWQSYGDSNLAAPMMMYIEYTLKDYKG